jgi:hypothetical protein
MKRTLLIVAFWVLFLNMAVSSTYAYEAMYGPSELIYWDPDKACNGYTLMSRYLIDMKGNVCHIFKSRGGELKEDGTMYGAGGMEFAKYDWDGNKLFDLEETRPEHHPHHDSNMIFNKKLNSETVIYISNKDLTHEQVIAAGADPTWSQNYEGAQMDCLVERDQNNNVVWEWCMYDHLIQDRFPDKDNYVERGKTIADYPGKMDINHGKTVRRDWNHCNGFDYNPDNGHIVLDQVSGEMWIIDHDGTFISTARDFATNPAAAAEANIAAAASDAGDFLWRFGDPAMYQQGDRPKINERDWSLYKGHKQMGTTHDAQWIRPGLPGAGNVMIYNNGAGMFESVPQSTVIEVNPYIAGIDEKTGKPIISDSYVNPPDAGYHMAGGRRNQRITSNQKVWEYRNSEQSGMLSTNGGNCIRLWNGNTLASNKTHGNFVEVTPDGEVVWEYINPVCRTGVKKIIGPGDFDTHPVGRAYRYPYDFPAFKGKNLTIKGTITELDARGLIAPPPPQEGGKGDKGGKGGRGGKK